MAARLLPLGIVALALSTVLVHVAVAQPSTVAFVGADRLALRRGPGKEFPPFDSLKAGSRVEIEEIEGEWARVITPNGQRGYVHSNFLQIPGEPAPAAAPGQESPRPLPTATVPRPTERKRPPTPSPTRTQKKRATATPSWTATRRADAAAAAATPTAERSRQLTEEVNTLSARNAALEAELRAALDTVAALKGGAAASTPAAGADVSDELIRLTAIVNALQKQLEAQTARAGTGTISPVADVRQGLSSATVGAGVLGIAVGWVLGTLLGRRADRSRRGRIRF